MKSECSILRTCASAVYLSNAVSGLCRAVLDWEDD